MSEVAIIIVPVFSLIALGYVASRFAWVANGTQQGLASFTFTLAIPAMLFRAMATAELPDVSPFQIWGAFFSVLALVWIAATVATLTLLRRPAPDAASIAMTSTYGNIVMIGIPICLGSLGPEAAGPIAMIVSIHAPLLWIAATVHLALSGQVEGSLRDLGAKLFEDLSRNLIILSIIAGSLWRLTGVGLDPVIDKSIAFLGQAAIPCALVSLGLSLTQFEIKGQLPTLTTVVLLKLFAMPVLAWASAIYVFAVPPVAAGVIIIFAAMPAGANAYLFATQHGRAMNSASGAVALGTALSIITSAALLALVIQRV